MKHLALLSVLLLAALCCNKAYSSPHVRMLALSGKVLNADSRLPVVSTITVIAESFKPIEITTNEKGEFKALIPAESKYTILAKANGYDAQEEIVTIPQFETTTSRYVAIRLTPHVKATLDGLVLSQKDQKPIEAEINIYHCSDYIKVDSKTLQNGKLNESLTRFGWYMVDLSAPGYQTVVDTLWVLSDKYKIIHKKYYLQSIEPGVTIELRNVNFNFGKATITDDSYAALGEVVQFLGKNPTLQTEIGGHTDSEGADEYNLFLSQARAQAVVDYLVGNGIDRSKLIAKGYGETKPLASNTTENGKATNRRVELVVIKK